MYIQHQGLIQNFSDGAAKGKWRALNVASVASREAARGGGCGRGFAHSCKKSPFPDLRGTQMRICVLALGVLALAQNWGHLA